MPRAAKGNAILSIRLRRQAQRLDYNRNEDAERRWRAGVSGRGMIEPLGKEGHFGELLRETPDDCSCRSVMPFIEHPCLPSLRQQAGSFEFEPANTADGISDKLNTSSSKTVDARRKP